MVHKSTDLVLVAVNTFFTHLETSESQSKTPGGFFHLAARQNHYKLKAKSSVELLCDSSVIGSTPAETRCSGGLHRSGALPSPPRLLGRGSHLPQGPGSTLREEIWPPAYGRGLSNPGAWKQRLGFLCCRNRVTHYTATSVVLGRMHCLKQNLGQRGRQNL